MVQERDILVGQLNRNTGLIRQVQGALVRIEEGGFGYCQGCDEEIAEARLAVVPWAEYCKECQEREEREGRK